MIMAGCWQRVAFATQSSLQSSACHQFANFSGRVYNLQADLQEVDGAHTWQSL